MKITLLEPQCRGLEHVPFNAALLRTVLLAWPDADVVFSGEPTHVANVREALGDSLPDQKIAWRNDFGGMARGDNISGLPGLFRAAFRLGRYCRNENVGVLILCSASPALLAAVTAMRPRRTAVIVVLHACLAQLRYNPLTQCLRNPFSIHAVARIPVPLGMRVVVLGEPILNNVRALGLASKRWASIDHPCLSMRDETSALPPQPVRFGYLAGFERNSSETREMLERVKSASGCGVNWIGRESGSSEALDSGEYRRRLRESHYAIWLGDASAARLRASATFLDAMAMGKPLIYLKNDFVDYYNSHRGPFGFPVSTVAELEDMLIRLARTPLDENYELLSRTARAVSRTFSPETIAPGLRAIITAACDETKNR
ncbi:MAG: glycosyltransferase [Terrimicrobiaceae bacterium]